MCLMITYLLPIETLNIEISNLVVPRNIKEALGDQNWKYAVFEEMKALQKNNTWDVIDLPRDEKIKG